MFDTLLNMVENGGLKVDNDFWGYKSIDGGIEDLCCKTYLFTKVTNINTSQTVSFYESRLSVENP